MIPRRKLMNGDPIAIFPSQTSLQYCPAPDRSLRGTREVMLATAKNSLGVYASLVHLDADSGQSSREVGRLLRELHWRFLLIYLLAVRIFGGARGSYYLLSDPQQKWELQFSELQTILWARSGSSALSTHSSFSKPIQFVSIVVITIRSV